MSPTIKTERPPNFDAISRRFPGARGHGVIFAYAPYIYAPHHKPDALPPELIAHESVHIERQERMGVERWWAAYLVNDQFRYVEELLAHRAEYQHLSTLSRQVRRSALKDVAKKLTAPLYGRMVNIEDAMRDLAHPNIDGCPACLGLGTNADLIECGKCEGLGYIEGEAA